MFTVFIKDSLSPKRQELYCIFLLGVCFFFLTGGSFWWYGRRTEDLVYLASQRTGRGLVESIMLRHHYQKLETIDNKELEKMLGPGLGNQEYSWSLIKPEVDGTDQPRDEFERDLLKKFQQPNPPPFAEHRVHDKAEYEYYQPVRAKTLACITCHNLYRPAAGLPELKNGDLMAIVKVVLPDGENIDAIGWNRARLISVAIATIMLTLVAAYLIIHHVLVKPLRHSRPPTAT